MDPVIKEANRIYLENFKPITWFGKCIFISWYCDLASCKFCFRASIKNKVKAEKARRSLASILVETFLAKKLGWRIEFITGGCKSLPFDELLDIIKNVSLIYDKKIWINLGLFNKEQLEELRPYVEGVCASIETINPELHREVCPDKPIEPYEEMLQKADGFKKSITIIIGLCEKREDFELLADFIERNNLDRITFYALKPVEGTIYKESPCVEDYSWWIAKTRIRFPKLEIMAGLTPKRIEYVKPVLIAGANAITKFPAIRKFASEKCKEIEEQVKDAGRAFLGTLTKLPSINVDEEVANSKIDEDLKHDFKVKLEKYINVLKNRSQ